MIFTGGYPQSRSTSYFVVKSILTFLSTNVKNQVYRSCAFFEMFYTWYSIITPCEHLIFIVFYSWYDENVLCLGSGQLIVYVWNDSLDST